MSVARLKVRFTKLVPPGDDRERSVCDSCGYVDYQNPKVVVGSVATWEGKILLCRRAIPPRVGFWTIPAGYMELHESPEEGALREAYEEARARLEVIDLLAVYTIRRISQVQMIYRARLTSPQVAAGPESQEVKLFEPSEVPVDAIAFPSVHWALAHYRASVGVQAWVPQRNPPGEDGRMALP